MFSLSKTMIFTFSRISEPGKVLVCFWRPSGAPRRAHLYTWDTSAPSPQNFSFASLSQDLLDKISSLGFLQLRPTKRRSPYPPHSPDALRGRRTDWPAATAADPEKMNASLRSLPKSTRFLKRLRSRFTSTRFSKRIATPRSKS